CTISSQVKEEHHYAHSICTRLNTRVGGSPEQIIHSYILRATNHVRTCANYELSKGCVFRPTYAIVGKKPEAFYREPEHPKTRQRTTRLFRPAMSKRCVERGIHLQLKPA